jgi:hypothetical protein
MQKEKSGKPMDDVQLVRTDREAAIDLKSVEGVMELKDVVIITVTGEDLENNIPA